MTASWTISSQYPSSRPSTRSYEDDDTLSGLLDGGGQTNAILTGIIATDARDFQADLVQAVRSRAAQLRRTQRPTQAPKVEVGGGGRLPTFLTAIDALKTVVFEHGYFDIDTRSEHAASVTRQFTLSGPVTDRLHFFAGAVDGQMILAAISGDESERKKLQELYRGYMVLRHSNPRRLIGRSLIAPPTTVADSEGVVWKVATRVRTEVSEDLMLCGLSLVARGVPFIEQDEYTTRCAHAVAWMAHYTAVLRGLVPRIPLADIHVVSEQAPPALQRQYPSPGLTDEQLIRALWRCGLPPEIKASSELTAPRKVFWYDRKTVQDAGALHHWHTENVAAYVARYLNSGLPVLFAQDDHVVAVCGYVRWRDRVAATADEQEAGSVAGFIVHDDAQGPYRVRPLHEFMRQKSSNDDQVIVPVPPGLVLGGSSAEKVGADLLEKQVRELAKADIAKVGRPLRSLFGATKLRMQTHQLAVRAYACASSDYKESFPRRCTATEAQTLVRLARLPRYVWVVELLQRDRRTNELPSVVGEVLLDGTAPRWEDARAMVLHVPGYIAVLDHLTGSVAESYCSSDYYKSGRWDLEDDVATGFGSVRRRSKTAGT